MKEVKFRRFDKHNKSMVYNGICFDEFNCINDQFNNDDFVYMQYTGLKDKNGKEIYSGDIVQLEDYEGFYISKVGKIGEVEIRYQDYDMNLISWAIGDNIFSVEVIGNIYETPELLQG
jgi:uncharacterized phage protein (TIGR01671 family)